MLLEGEEVVDAENTENRACEGVDNSNSFKRFVYFIGNNKEHFCP